MTVYVLAAATAVLVSCLAVPPTVRLARARNLLDTPDADRRVHRHAVPRLGGIAVWLGAIAGLVAVTFATKGGLAIPAQWWGAVAGLGLMTVVGLVDDVRGLRPSHKLAAQSVAALLAVGAGFSVDGVALSPEARFDLGWLSIPVTLLWLVGVTNAFNLIDGLDGLAGGIALVALAAVGVAAVALGNAAVLLPLAVALAGGIAGFLRFNASRAQIFLGDGGSLSIGFALAVLAVEGARAPSGDVYMLVPLFALAFPLLDTAIAMFRRWLRGVPLSGADGRHVHHQLVGLGLTHGRAAALICVFASGIAGLGLSISFAPPTLTIALVTLGAIGWVLLVVHGTRWLQYHEFSEAQASLSSGLLRARQVIRDRILARDLEAQIRRAGSLAELERVLDQSCATFGFERVQLCDALGHGGRFVGEPAAPAGRLYRLECPLSIGVPDGQVEYHLRLSWRADVRMPPLYAERVVRLIAPALQTTLLALRPSRPDARVLGAAFDLAGAAVATPPAGAPALVPELRPRRAAGALSRR